MDFFLPSDNDTIVALATPAGVGAISVIRVSGDKSISAVDKLFGGKLKLINSESHKIHYGRIEKGNQVIDDVLVSVFKNPNSYTGEDSVEISAHGNPYITSKIINELVELDVRLAEPGEFTKRAFLNGKLDLIQAEAVADVINSRTEASLKGARNQLDGMLSKHVNSLREKLINTSSLIELELDFAEEDIEFMSLKKIKENINSVISEIKKLLKSFTYGRVIRDGINVALVGIPNVGKSSLLNLLLKESRAIVSHIPGTTRDIIREEISIDGFLFRIYDTAGIRLTEDVIEKEGVIRSREVVKNADIVIFINDVINGFSVELYNQLLELTSKEKIITLMNKIDLSHEASSNSDVKVSALTEEGIENLFDKLKEKSIGENPFTERSSLVTNIRHFKALEKAKISLDNSIESINNGMTGEYISVDLRNAESTLGEIIGKVTTDDILNNIFSKFCIGK
ncbi:MAG: tRNA uridine-5-carboxymethylaminomethyl(34) synthesis GTPase MnmE [Ignavibacteria bacterium]|jgi:tRNA modification GTPase